MPAGLFVRLTFVLYMYVVLLYTYLSTIYIQICSFPLGLHSPTVRQTFSGCLTEM